MHCRRSPAVCSGEREVARSMSEPNDEALFALVVTAARERAPTRRAAIGQGEADGRQALEALFERYHRRTFHWCLAVLGDVELAADTVNDIFLDLLQRPHPHQARQRFAPWLYVAARNRCLNLLRRRRREELVDDPLEQALAHAVSDDDPLHDAERAELDQAIRAACREYLSPREQEVVHLRYAVGMKVGEITALLRLDNASGARTQLRSAERKLRIALRDRFRAPTDRAPGGQS